MPLLQPNKIKAAQELLSELETASQSNGHAVPGKNSRAREIFNSQGLTLERVARRASDILLTGEENNQLKVMDMALKVHGALEDETQKQAPIVNITFINANNVEKLEGVLLPR